jgi:bacillithiol biosynthesis cysteine-adding enzyme BshC
MKAHKIPSNSLDIYSELIKDYQDENKGLISSTTSFPKMDSLANLSAVKSKEFTDTNRKKLIKAFKEQYDNINISKNIEKNLNLLSKNNSVTITTGHQLSLMTGPLYFIYKIVSVIKLSIIMNKKKTGYNYIPVFWMASEDHDFEEISSFYFKGRKIIWKQSMGGPVGEISLDKLDFLSLFIENELGTSESSLFIKSIIKENYLTTKTLSEATFGLVNRLFCDYGLLILDPNSRKLKEIMIPFFKNELFNHNCKKQVDNQIEILKNDYNKNYKPQVNPREINLFYITKGERKRIIKTENGFELSDSNKKFTKPLIEKELIEFPERFSPNVLLRPLYQEVILPNIAYVGGGGEISYWLQLKAFFENQNITLPILVIRDSALLVPSKTLKSIEKLNVSYSDLLNGKDHLIKNKIKELSSISLDLQFLKNKLDSQFSYLEKIVSKTDSSFKGAVKAQKAKQYKGIDNLEKRLLRAQKRKLNDQVKKLEVIYNSLFPNNKLQERTENFFDYYLYFEHNFIPDLIDNFNPLNKNFIVFESK